MVRVGDEPQPAGGNFYDIRMFGAVMTTGVNCGQVREPAQLTFARSIDPVVPLDVSITRVAVTRPEDAEVVEGDDGKGSGGKQTEMGRKAMVPYGLYRAHGFFTPHFAKSSGADSEDLEVFWEALRLMWDLDRSSSRGLMTVRGLQRRPVRAVLPGPGLPAVGPGALGAAISRTEPRGGSFGDRRMKRHLNTLFVITQGAYLAKERETVSVRVDGETQLRLPILNLEGIVCFGNVSVSPYLLGMCGEKGVHVSMLTSYGRFLARVVGRTSGNVLLRREQYRRADDPEGAAEIARSVLLAKLLNSRAVLQRSLRDRPEEGDDPRRGAVTMLAALVRDIERTHDLDALRGVEGAAARSYFSAFDRLISPQSQGFRFTGRNRRPPIDPVNALLSFLYTLLRHDVTAALESVGLDPQVGFLHRDRPGRPGLALDLMEELRAPIADRIALTLINRRQVLAEGFETGETGGVVMNEATRKAVLVAYQEKKQAEITHPFLGETMTLGTLFHVQALLLARHLRGDLDAYPAFVAK